MTQPQRYSTRRKMLLGLAGAAIAAPATLALAQGFDEFDPIETLPRYYGVDQFLRLSKADIYKVNLAVRRNYQIIIGRFTPSESRKIIRQAAKDWPATREALRNGQY